MDDALRQAALDYHKNPKPGKIAILPTKPMTTQRDLALAYSPGVAVPCEEIAADHLKSYDYTSRGNVVAVISNGTAVLGLGNIGAYAAKPVMEGKSVLFKKFADIDSVDVEVNETDIDKFCDIVASLEPTYGGINLEDIKAPECFEIERRLRERMNIPVFHDDQHGTAIIVGAAFTNWLQWSGRNIKDIRLVASGAGAAALACLNILVGLGLPKDNITVTDRHGVVYKGRGDMDPYKEKYAIETNARTLDDAIADADVFLGLSGPKVLTRDMAAKMAAAPLVLALANPTPEIMPEEVYAVKPDAIVCTGRSDFNNQVNNVLCFPFIFRGALDVGATGINEEMKLACVRAIAELAREEVSAEVQAIYGSDFAFGRDYLIPKPFDPRLIVKVSMAVAKCAMETGVATRPITDFDAYREHLTQYVYRSNMLMRPLFTRAKSDLKRIVFAEGEEDRVLMAVQTIVDEKMSMPILIGRQKVVEARIKKLHLRLKVNEDFELVDPEDDPRYREYWMYYHAIMERKGVTPAVAKLVLRTNPTVIAALMVAKGLADSMICGVIGQYHEHLHHIQDIIGLKKGVETAAALVGLIIPNKGNLFICDTHINPNPSVAQLVEMTLLAAEQMRSFGVVPKIAFISHSNFGTHNHPSAIKMRQAVAEISRRDPSLEVDGEMHVDAALSEEIRHIIMPNSRMKGLANLLVMPNVEAANTTYNAVKILTDATPVGPLLLGCARPAHIVTSAVTTRGLVNVAAAAAVDAQNFEQVAG